MEVDRAESQTSLLTTMLLNQALRLAKLLEYDVLDDMNIPTYCILENIRIVFTDISEHTRMLGDKSLSQCVYLVPFHYFCKRLGEVVREIETWQVQDMYGAHKLDLSPNSELNRALDNVKYIQNFQRSLVSDDFSDPVEGEAEYLITKRSEIRAVMESFEDFMPFLQEMIEACWNCQERLLVLVRELQTHASPITYCLANCPQTFCAICDQQMGENVNFAAVDCCRHLFCVSCLKSRLHKKIDCPTCHKTISASVSRSYLKKPKFNDGIPKKFRMFVRVGIYGRLW